jgi:hypothetical protein
MYEYLQGKKLYELTLNKTSCTHRKHREGAGGGGSWRPEVAMRPWKIAQVSFFDELLRSANN